ncbi:MAG: hypothetical protein MJ185_08430 [Treponema sp.]|nr:hypothetical protein [Treponema sp.]
MMDDREKIYVYFLCGVFVAFCALYAVFAGINAHPKCRISQGTENYAAGSENAEKLSGGIQQRVGELEDQMRTAGKETSECITELRDSVTEIGRLRNDCDRIAEAGRGIKESADSIEERILLCLQVLGVSEEEAEILDGDSPGFYDPGGQ